jgi:hypothetical protein
MVYFPSDQRLGAQRDAERFGVRSLEEARAYANHPVLGPRLRLVTESVNAVAERAIQQILGPPDDLKFRSCMTLFARAYRDNGGDPHGWMNDGRKRTTIDSANIGDRECQFDLGQACGLPSGEVSECN